MIATATEHAAERHVKSLLSHERNRLLAIDYAAVLWRNGESHVRIVTRRRLAEDDALPSVLYLLGFLAARPLTRAVFDRVMSFVADAPHWRALGRGPMPDPIEARMGAVVAVIKRSRAAYPMDAVRTRNGGVWQMPLARFEERLAEALDASHYRDIAAPLAQIA